jgi:predicted negative regulator of RcsB-dependent stress response
MAYDLEEQERIAALTDWWEANRLYVIGAIVLALAAVGGYQLYKLMMVRAADAAAMAYKDVEKAAKDNDAKKTSALALTLAEQHAKSFDASKAALMAAKLAFDANDLATARKHLEWAAEKGDSTHRPIARVRLATVLLDEKKPDEALKQLDLVRDDGFATLVGELRGDIFLVLGRIDEARASYKAALDKADQRNPSRSILETKLAAVGGNPTPTPAAVTAAATTDAPKN